MTFPTNLPAVTVWEKTLVNRAPAYVRHELGDAYWEDVRGQSNGRTEDNGIFLALPAASVTEYVPKTDDRILPGSIADEKPPGDALTVMQVKDFRYLLPMMAHLEATLK